MTRFMATHAIIAHNLECATTLYEHDIAMDEMAMLRKEFADVVAEIEAEKAWAEYRQPEISALTFCIGEVM